MQQSLLICGTIQFQERNHNFFANVFLELVPEFLLLDHFVWLKFSVRNGEGCWH